MFTVLPNASECLKDRGSTSIEHVCMYVCTSSCILKSVCNLYIIEDGKEIVTFFLGLVAWKILYCMFHCLVDFQLIRFFSKEGHYLPKRERERERVGGVIRSIQGCFSVF